MRKWLISILVVALFVLPGCGAVNQALTPQPDYARTTLEPMTAMEYTNKVDQMLMPLMNEGETLLAHSINLTQGRFPVEEEMPQVEAVIDGVQSTTKAIDALYPPPNYVDHKTKTVLALTTYKNALERYRAALLTKDPKNISSAADGMRIAIASVKAQYDLYSR